LEVFMVFNRKPDVTAAANLKPVATQPVSSAPPAPFAGGNYAAATASEPESIIGNDLSIEGQSITIRCQGSLRVNGNIQADLHSKKLSVGETATITGSITASEVAVYGRVEGSIYGSLVTLHRSAHVEGDIHSQSLSIESGASFDGRLRKVANASEIAPQLTPSATSASGTRQPAPMTPPGTATQGLFTPGANRVS
jgi:cytoskeletal protein CcmA (bactofilin family)